MLNAAVIMDEDLSSPKTKPSLNQGWFYTIKFLLARFRDKYNMAL
jgi:hypothetical protein